MADVRDDESESVKIWKTKKLIKALEAARGNGMSMISLILPPGDQIARVTKMLGDEFETASNIESKVNQQSVLGAITFAKQRLKLYYKVPDNGLVLYTGTVMTEDGKEKKVTFNFEPFKPINASLYRCDNKFHTEALSELVYETDDKYGFVVMGRKTTLFGTLGGNRRKGLHDFYMDFLIPVVRHPDNTEKRLFYVSKAAELATHFYINPSTGQPNVSGLILAASADYITDLSEPDVFDPRLQAKILNVVEIIDGGVLGFNEAIELSAEILSHVKYIQEEKLIEKYFKEISQDTGKYAFGVDDTLKALEMGAIATLIVWENLDMNRYVLKNDATGEIVIKHYNNKDPVSNVAGYKVQEKMLLVDWLSNEYQRYGCVLEFVTDKSQRGEQFCRSLYGIGGILRYKVELGSSRNQSHRASTEELDEVFDDFFD